jgi:protein-S-isoprenylcysteine O-methyltransferase Ste14
MRSPAFVVSALVSTVGCLGLAILGAGGFAAFFSHAPLTVVAIAVLVMAVASLFAHGNLSSGEHEDRGDRWVLSAFWVISLLSAFLPAYTDRTDFWVIDGEAIRWVGVALYIVGGAMRMWPIFVLGDRFSGLVAIQRGHRLVTDGIYGSRRLLLICLYFLPFHRNNPPFAHLANGSRILGRVLGIPRRGGGLHPGLVL